MPSNSITKNKSSFSLGKANTSRQNKRADERTPTSAPARWWYSPQTVALANHFRRGRHCVPPTKISRFHPNVCWWCLYTTQLEHISSLKSNSQRAERVVTLYFYIRIRVRGDATGEGSPPAAIQRFPSFFILAERGLGRAAINTKGNFGVAKGSYHKYRFPSYV